MTPHSDSLDEIVRSVQSSAKYATIDERFVRRIAASECTRRKSRKEIIKETKRTLHQVSGAYFNGTPRFGEWETELQQTVDEATMQGVLRRLLDRSPATRERMKEMDTIYEWIFSRVGLVTTVQDIGCGLNPLAIPWMPIVRSVRYEAYDLYTDLADFLNRFFQLIGQNGVAYACDVTGDTHRTPADLALLMKILPLIDHLPGGNVLALLHRIPARWLAVTFPASSLGGKEKGMAKHYTDRMNTLVHGQGWDIHRQVFTSELVFLVDKGIASAIPLPGV